MQVFKTYFKIMRSLKISLFLNLIIFFTLTAFFITTAPQKDEAIFEPSKANIAIINKDKDAPLASALEDYLANLGQQIILADDKEAMQDALFYRRAEYIAIIPAGFSEQFMMGQLPLIETISVPGSSIYYYMDMNVDAFLSAAHFYLSQGEYSQIELVRQVLADFEIETKVSMRQSINSASYPSYAYYFRYCAYALLAIIVNGISSIMLTFNQVDLHLRNLCSPVPERKIALQILAGHSILALACWVLLMLQSILMYGQELLRSGLVPYYFLNTFAFTLVAISIAFLTGNIVKTHSTQAGAVQVLALGLNFLGGVFVDQEVMSKSVLAIARFLPTFWFVRANNLITSLGTLSKANLVPIYVDILVQMGFAIATFSFAFFLRKSTKASSSLGYENY